MFAWNLSGAVYCLCLVARGDALSAVYLGLVRCCVRCDREGWDALICWKESRLSKYRSVCWLGMAPFKSLPSLDQSRVRRRTALRGGGSPGFGASLTHTYTEEAELFKVLGANLERLSRVRVGEV